jgi:hypothetical protein
MVKNFVIDELKNLCIQIKILYNTCSTEYSESSIVIESEFPLKLYSHHNQQFT